LQRILELAQFNPPLLGILILSDSILKRLDAPTKAPAWPVGSEGELIWPAPTEAMYLEKPE